MLIEFSVANYLSFKERATLFLTSSALKDTKVDDADAMFDAGEAVSPLLHGAAIYGANASGKSNLIKAFHFFKWFIINSMKSVQAGEKLGVEPFRLNTTTVDEPSMFEVAFATTEHIYRYGFEADNNMVYREWCYRRTNKKRAKEVELFFREEEKYNVHSSFSMAKELTAKNMVRENALLISVLAQFNDPMAKLLISWLGDTSVISDKDDEEMWQEAAVRLDDQKMRRRIVEFSKYADLGIEDIFKLNNDIVSSHVQYDDEGRAVRDIDFSFDKNESDGTIKYFRLAYPIIDALDKGKRLVIDELDSRLHPLLTMKIVELFNSHRTNPKHAQLVFTLHDTMLLNQPILRRDQIWFTQKDGLGASELFSLSEYKVRNTAAYERDYLGGKYGGTPITGDFERLFMEE